MWQCVCLGEGGLCRNARPQESREFVFFREGLTWTWKILTRYMQCVVLQAELRYYKVSEAITTVSFGVFACVMFVLLMQTLHGPALHYVELVGESCVCLCTPNTNHLQTSCLPFICTEQAVWEHRETNDYLGIVKLLQRIMVYCSYSQKSHFTTANKDPERRFSLSFLITE